VSAKLPIETPGLARAPLPNIIRHAKGRYISSRSAWRTPTENDWASSLRYHTYPRFNSISRRRKTCAVVEHAIEPAPLHNRQPVARTERHRIGVWRPPNSTFATRAPHRATTLFARSIWKPRNPAR
jgi:hypothetical protein